MAVSVFTPRRRGSSAPAGRKLSKRLALGSVSMQAPRWYTRHERLTHSRRQPEMIDLTRRVVRGRRATFRKQASEEIARTVRSGIAMDILSGDHWLDRGNGFGTKYLGILLKISSERMSVFCLRYTDGEA